MKIRDWLAELGLERYAPQFEENDIDKDVLTSLTDADLKEIGITSLGARKRILARIHDDQPTSVQRHQPTDLAPQNHDDAAVDAIFNVHKATHEAIQREHRTSMTHLGATVSGDLTGSHSAIIAYILWFFLGALGAHRIYTNHIGTGLAQAGLALSIYILLPLALMGTTVLWPFAVLGLLLHGDSPESAAHTAGLAFTGAGVVLLAWCAAVCGHLLWWLIDLAMIPGLVMRANMMEDPYM